jgi:D-alanine-D-alanine ligase
MRVAVLANLKKNAPRWDGMSPDQWDDLDSEKTVNAIVAALESGGHEAAFFEASILTPFSLVERLMAYRPDICFNIAESHFGDGREAQIPAVLEMLRLPYTGSQVMTLALALDKPMTKRILHYHGLPTPEFQVFERADEPIDDDLLDSSGDLRFPLFVKPSREGTSMGVSADSIVHSVDQLRQRIAGHLERYNQPILVEHYISGREVLVGMLGNMRPNEARRLNERTWHGILPETLTFLPLLELDTEAYADTQADLYTNWMKTQLSAEEYRYHCPARLGPALERELQTLAAAVFRVIGCRDVSRVDFRLDGDKPYILEVNPLPGLSPGFSDLCLQAQGAGWSYERLINTILDHALERHGLKLAD